MGRNLEYQPEDREPVFAVFFPEVGEDSPVTPWAVTTALLEALELRGTYVESIVWAAYRHYLMDCPDSETGWELVAEAIAGGTRFDVYNGTEWLEVYAPRVGRDREDCRHEERDPDGYCQRCEDGRRLEAAAVESSRLERQPASEDDISRAVRVALQRKQAHLEAFAVARLAASHYAGMSGTRHANAVASAARKLEAAAGRLEDLMGGASNVDA